MNAIRPSATAVLLLTLACDPDSPPKDASTVIARPGQRNEKAQLSNAAEAEALRHRDLIEREVQKLIGQHSWAGSYYHGDGKGANLSLILAPEEGFVFRWRGCLGVYDRNYGAVETLEDGSLKLHVELPNSEKGFRGVPEVLVPVTWGARRYLIPPDQMIQFCDDVNRGREPRTRLHGHHFLVWGDHEAPVSGFPEVPEAYRKHLPKGSLSGQITAGPKVDPPAP